MAILVTRLATGGAIFQAEKGPKMVITRVSRTYRASANLLETKTSKKSLASDAEKYRTFWSPGKSGYGRFIAKNTQNGNKSRWPAG